MEKKENPLQEKYLKQMQDVWLEFADDKADLHEKLDKILLEALKEVGLKKIVEFYENCDNLRDGFWYA